MSPFEHPLFLQMASYAYDPWLVYAFVIAMMLASAVGFPLPEEVTLVSVGLLVYMGSRPDLYPPPFPDAPRVELWTTIWVCFLAVILSDHLIYFVGRWGGPFVMRSRTVSRFLTPKVMGRVKKATTRYGHWACIIFRFTPGFRFPGHLALGMMKFPLWKFFTLDGLAVVLSVPVQVYLVARYGETIIHALNEAKYLILAVIVGACVYFVGRRCVVRYATSRMEPSKGI